MAISVDKVYQKVLALANKEQRGYITPQEFNLFANQAQQEIFEQYFYDLNQFMRVPGNNTVYADVDDMLEEKLAIFETTGTITSDTFDNTDVYRLGTVYNSSNTEVEEVQANEILYLNKRQQTPGNDSYYADITTNIQSKISMFEVSEQSVSVQSGSLAYLSNDLSNFY